MNWKNAIAFPLLLSVAAACNAQQMPWRANWKTAQAEAAKSAKPVMIDFFAVW